MDREGIGLRREISRHEGGRGRRYSVELRERVRRWAALRREQGQSWTAIASELGLGLDTLRRWCAVSPSTALVAVTVIADGSSERLVSIASPMGFRIEGLSLAEASELLRALG